MKGHFDTFTEVDSRVNECNLDFSALKDGKSLFYLVVYLALFYRNKGTPCCANVSNKESNQIYCYRLWLK